MLLDVSAIREVQVGVTIHLCKLVRRRDGALNFEHVLTTFKKLLLLGKNGKVSSWHRKMRS
ncbi:hypothetical protein Peur_035095 [Populus x canadensis]